MDSSLPTSTAFPRPDGKGWIGRDLTDSNDWKVEIPADVITTLVDQVREIAASHEMASPSDDSTVAAMFDSVRRELVSGRGFVLMRGIPVDDLNETENAIMTTVLGRLVGVPIRQNAAGEQLVRVRDSGSSFDDEGVRSYETAAPLPFHSDSSDVVGLYCIRSARSGGASTIVSSAALHDAMLATRPDLAGLLHQPWATASVVAGTIEQMPICAADRHGAVFTRYGRRYVEPATDADVDLAALSSERTDALDLYDSFLADPDFALDMHFRPGDLQFLNNYRVMHSRAPYVDWPDPARRRELLRVWLVLSEMEVPDVFEDSGFVPRGEALA
jgi:hypothetical protein